VAHSLVIGGRPVGSAEFAEMIALGTIEQFETSAEHSGAIRRGLEALTAKGGALAPEYSGGLPGFEEIGLGRPLSLEILSVYTGDAPSRYFGGKPDLLVASAVKGIETFDAAPRAINQLVGHISDRQFIEPSALDSGCPVIYYTPSLVSGTVQCSLELVVDAVDQQVFQQVSGLLGAAAGLPIFAPATMYLVAGSILVKIAGGLAKILLQTAPFLTENLPLRFDTPGMPQAKARQMIAYNDRDAGELAAYDVALVGPDGKQRVALVEKQSGKEYAGKAPYVIVNLDGRRRPDLDGFTPRLASAAVLERFYLGQDAGGQVVNILESAMELYNDFAFRQRAEKIRSQIQGLDSSSPTYAKDKETFEKLLAAYTGNIRNSLFKQ
jgi:hypothetical protein